MHLLSDMYKVLQFGAADLNHDGVIDADEFHLYYFKEICFKFPVGKNGYNPGEISFTSCMPITCSLSRVFI